MTGDAQFLLAQADVAAPAPSAAETTPLSATTEAVNPETVFPPFDMSTYPSTILWLVITFGALYLMLSRVAVPRLAGIGEARRGRIEGDLAEADRLRQATDKAIADYEAALAEARGKAHAIAEETRGRIRADLEAKRSGVEAELAEKMSAAEAEIQKAKSEALAKVDEIAADLTASVVTTLQGEITPEEARAAVAAAGKETVS